MMFMAYSILFLTLGDVTENVAKDTSKGSLFDCQENVSHYTYYCLNNQCEY